VSALLLCLLLMLAPQPTGSGLLTVLSRPELKGARVAVVVMDAETGRTLHELRPDEPLLPASNMKLLTTAAAVSGLGADFVFSTSLLAETEPGPDGVLPGDLIVVGSGDPSLRTDVLEPFGGQGPAALLAEIVAAAGVTDVQGCLRLDDSIFDREWVHPSWERDDLGRAYAAPVGALSLEGNCLHVVFDARSRGESPWASLSAPVSGYALENEVHWSDKPGRYIVGALRPRVDGTVKLTGHISRGVIGQPVAVPVRNATRLFGASLLGALRGRGIRVHGGICLDGSGGAGEVELGRIETPLDRALFLANKDSDNTVTEHLFKAIGAQAEGQGSFASGARAMGHFLRSTVGVSTAGLVLADGSGLSRSNRVSARALAATLASMHASPQPERDLFLRSLSVAGLDGTLTKRLREAPYRGAVRAKSGYIGGVSSLSGLAWTRSGRVLAFSILINGYATKYRNQDMKRIQDDLCRELVSRW